jgi:hypothetical protein
LGRFSRSKGGLVTFGVVIGLLVALGLTVFGLGAQDHALATDNASAWLYSSSKGEVARVNAETGRVDTRFRVVDAQGHVIQVSQSDRYLILRDLTTGKVSSLDLATLQIAATTETAAGVGVTLALNRDAAFVVDAVQGVVRQLDPVALTPIGDPLRFPPGVSGGTFDGTGTLWLLVASEGTVVAVKPGDPHPSQGTASAPVKARTIAVAPPNHDLSMSTLSNGVAVLDSTATTLTMVQGDQPKTVPVPMSGTGSLPPQSTGDAVPVTVLDDRHVYVINGTHVGAFTVPGTGKIDPAVPFGGRLYIADQAAGSVYVLDADGKLVDTITIPNAGGKLELSIRGDHLFVNAPNSSSARVVDHKGHVKVVDKYANNILGGDPPPNPPPQPPKAPPPVGPPSAPTKVVATAGNTTVHLTWGAANPNGAAITKYVVEGDGKPHDVGANQRALDIGGLTNGQQYVFTVYAVNAKGSGPKKASNPVVPTSAVPDAPLSVTATANKDGTVTVTWPAANGQGHPVTRYDITQVQAGAQAPLSSVTGTTATIPAGTLTYGTQYAFLVTAVNNLGTASKPSPLSNTVVPFTVPGAPTNVAAATVNAKGTISVSWAPGADNGRAITGYQLTVNGATQNVTGTSTQLTGFADNTPVTVTVRGVNAAGAGPPSRAVTATTIAPPDLTPGSATAKGYNTINVSFTTNGHGSPPTCTISLNGGGATGIACTGQDITGLWPATVYNFTVTATNKAGSRSYSGSVTTPTLNDTVICPKNTNGYCNSGIWTYRQPTQSGTAVRALSVGTRFKADCWVNGGGSAGATVNATPWGGKNSSIWIRFTGNGTEYFPWSWSNLDGGDNYRLLPGC